ncbi:MAG: tetratricopeptide repeat protein [Pseudomonadota bacterium]
MSELAQQFQQAVTALQQQQFAEAEQIAQQLNQRSPDHPDILHLLALASKQTAPEKAFEYFQRSLKINPRQPTVLSNFANFLQASQQLRGAKQSYLQALQLNPDLTDAWYNLASLHYQSRDYLAASHAAAKALALKPDFLKAVILKSRAELDYKLFNKAEITLTEALKRWPKESSLHVNRALLYRYTGRTTEARDIMQQLQNQIDEPQRQFQLGCLAYDEGQLTLAQQYLEQAIELQNDLVPAHDALNKLFWEHGPQQQFLSSFEQALKRQPDSLGLAYSYVSHLLRADRREQADTLLQQFLQRFGPVHSLLHLQGSELLRDGNIEQAAALFDRVLEQQPRHPRYLIDKANVLLRQQRYDEAFQLLDRAHENQPLDQEVHAFKGLCWKLSGDTEKAAELNDYQRFVKVGMLPTPPGYDSLQQFWPVLVERIQALHKTQHQPLDQSVRKGTQTVGSLLTIDDPIIQAYKDSLQQFIEDYLGQLPDDRQHPVTARLSGGYHFSGSWSVKLFKEGFHTNHVHPEGWLSLCTYLSVPDQVCEDDDEQKGWIRFGHTSLNLGERETVDQAVCPKPGMCVIFPSYSWHGTVPFDSDEERLTIPCDIMPS